MGECVICGKPCEGTFCRDKCGDIETSIHVVIPAPYKSPKPTKEQIRESAKYRLERCKKSRAFKENLPNFINEYQALTEKYQMHVTSCGCCPDWVEQGENTGKLEGNCE